MLKRFFVLLLVLAMASPLLACGRKSSPQPPPDNTYPRQYPTQ